MSRILNFRALAALGLLFPALASADVFLNEFHYDDADTPTTGDTNESVEIVATAGEDLSLYDIVLYNGNTPGAAMTYDTDPLPVGSLVACGATVRFATITYPLNGLQNGPSDGIALVLRSDSSVVQFLSYEGAITASNGPAAGMTSTNLPVSEAGTTVEGTSLQLGGNASNYAGFTWNASATATLGTCNNGQTFGAAPDLPPTVSSSNPAHNATGVAVDTALTVTFSESVNADADSFALNCGMGTPAINVSSGPASVYTLTPVAPLGYSRLCTLTVVGSEVFDVDGTADPMAANATIQFETEADDLPSVVSVTPVDQATGVDPRANLAVTFSEPVTAPAAAFGIFCPDTSMSSLAFQLSSADATTFTLNPDANLPTGTLCRLYVDNLQVTDQDGNPDNPDRDSSTTFTTGAIPPPSVVSTVPANNATGFPPGGDLQVVFDTSVTLSAGAFALNCTSSTGINLSHASTGTSFTIDTGTVLAEGDTCVLHIESSAILSGDGLPPDADKDINFTVSSTGPGNYYNGVDASSCSALRTSLHALIDDHTAFPYSVTGVPPAAAVDTWDILEAADQDPLNAARVLEVYENVPYTKAQGGNSNYNREHTWPNSYGFNNLSGATGTVPESAAYTDTHMLYLSDIEYNSNRGSKPYANCPQASGCTADVTQLYNGVGGGAVTYPGQHNWKLTDAGGEAFGSYEVWASRKGDMARAVLYMDIRYEGGTATGGNTIGQNEPELIVTDDRNLIHGSRSTASGTAYMGLKSVLLAWHAADPPDQQEQLRNAVIQSYQGNRNPFIDHPEWAECLFNCTCSANQPPVANDATFALAENSAVSTVVGTVVASDPDAGNTLSYAITAGNGSGAFGMSGNQVVVANATPLDFEATPQFVLTVTVSDNAVPSASDTATITINLSNVEEGPAVANNDNATVAEDSSNNAIAVLANDVADPDGGALAVTAVGSAQNGSTSFTPGGVSYTPNANHCGTDSFSYTIGGGASATVTVSVTCANDAPTIAAPLAARDGAVGQQAVPFSVAGGFSDVDGDDLDFNLTGLPAGMTFDAETGLVGGTPAAGSQTGSPYTVTVTASDGTLQVQQTFTFTVTLLPNRVFASGFEGS